MEEAWGHKLSDEAEMVARQKIVMSTPLLGGRYWYHEKERVSRWTISDLHRRRHAVSGVGFSSFGHITTHRPAFLLAPLAYCIPWMSSILLFWKNLKRKKVSHEDSSGN